MSTAARPASSSAIGSPRILISAGLVAILIVGFMVFQVTSAAFTDTTSNTGNSWTAGEVAITDDAAGVAIFDATGLVPGWSQSQDIVVSNGSSVATDVAFFAEGLSGELAPYLNVEISVGEDTLYSGAMADLATAHSAFENGSRTGAPASGSDATYTIAVSFPDVEGVNAAQGTGATIDFVWEARSN